MIPLFSYDRTTAYRSQDPEGREWSRLEVILIYDQVRLHSLPSGSWHNWNTLDSFSYFDKLQDGLFSLTAGSKAPYYTGLFQVKLKQQNKLLITHVINVKLFHLESQELRCGCNGKCRAYDRFQIHSFTALRSLQITALAARFLVCAQQSFPARKLKSSSAVAGRK